MLSSRDESSVVVIERSRLEVDCPDGIGEVDAPLGERVVARRMKPRHREIASGIITDCMLVIGRDPVSTYWAQSIGSSSQLLLPDGSELGHCMAMCWHCSPQVAGLEQLVHRMSDGMGA